jgi:hypothetical protein
MRKYTRPPSATVTYISTHYTACVPRLSLKFYTSINLYVRDTQLRHFLCGSGQNKFMRIRLSFLPICKRPKVFKCKKWYKNLPYQIVTEPHHFDRASMSAPAQLRFQFLLSHSIIGRVISLTNR